MSKLSLCMIVRNESAHLDKCIDSVRDTVSEIIVVDTGSDDSTRDIARQRNARLFDFEWTDDFSAARNYALTQATGDWILVLDADETLSSSDHQHLKELLENPDVDAYSLTQRTYGNNLRHAFYVPRGDDPYPESRGYAGWIASNLVRLFRNRCDYRFRYRVHEVIEPSIKSAGASISRSDIPIHHYNHERDKTQIEAKLMYYLRLGLLQIQDTPGDPKPYLEVSQVYLECGKYADAEKILNMAISLSPAPPEIYDLLGTLYLHTQRPTEAQKALEVGLARRPDDVVMLNKLASAHLATGQFNLAEQILDRALIVAPDSVKTFNNLGLLFAVTNRPAEAVAAFEKALALDPRNIYALTSLGMMYINARTFSTARQHLELAHTMDGDNPKILYHLALACHELGDTNRAVQLLKHAQTITPGDPAITGCLDRLCR